MPYLKDARPITPSADTLDSRDIIERIEWLESEHNDTDCAAGCVDESEHEELDALIALQLEADGYCDWQHGATLIRESYFERYAQQWANDIGAMPDKALSWPFNCIDWERAANELRRDFTEVEFDGVTYLVQS